MTDLLPMFKDFIEDKEAWDMFITGYAGTGKTTQLKWLVKYCIDKEIPHLICAHTHKACGVLRSKLPTSTIVNTLHKYLKKRPTLNEHATKAKHVTVSKQQSIPEIIGVIFIDEYSMISDADKCDIAVIQDPTYEGLPTLKVVYIGDPYQLPPIGEPVAIIPNGKYQGRLNRVYRQSNDNPLKNTIEALLYNLDGDVCPLPESWAFQRGKDIIKEFLADNNKDKIILAYTNKAVQELNAKIEYEDSETNPGIVIWDNVYCPQNRKNYKVLELFERAKIDYIETIRNEDLRLGSKFKTLEHLLTMPDIEFALLEDDDNNVDVKAFIYGHYNYKIYLEQFKKDAAASNKKIEDIMKVPAKAWSTSNKRHPLARARAKAWRDFLTFSDCVICLDFPHAITVHKSQGSTYDTVYLDMEDLSLCIKMDYKMYLRLAYVAISRASNKVITN